MVGSLRRLVAEMGGELRGGDADAPILGIVPPDEAQGGDLTLYVDGRYREDMSSTRAVAVVTDRAHAGAVVESGRVAWVVDDPGAAVARLVDLLCPDVTDLPPPLELARLRVFPLAQRESLPTVDEILVDPAAPPPPVTRAAIARLKMRSNRGRNPGTAMSACTL